MNKWIQKARKLAMSRYQFDLSPLQTKTLALLLELRGEGRPAVVKSGAGGPRKSTLKALAKRNLVKIVEENGTTATAELT
jgi:hypothetical protein